MYIQKLNKETTLHWIQKLSQHISKNRWQLIQKVVQARTKYINVVLEDIYQEHNAAAVVRSCDGFGIQDLYIIEKINKLDLKNTTVSKGAKKWLDFHYYKDTPSCIQTLKNQGYKISALALGKKSIKIEDVPLNNPLALMIGNEMKGLSQEACEMADYFIELPMYGFTQSYNLSVCAAISMHVLVNRLRHSQINWQLTEDDQQKLTLSWLQRCIRHWEKIVL